LELEGNLGGGLFGVRSAEQDKTENKLLEQFEERVNIEEIKKMIERKLKDFGAEEITTK